MAGRAILRVVYQLAGPRGPRKPRQLVARETTSGVDGRRAWNVYDKDSYLWTESDIQIKARLAPGEEWPYGV